jgi:hypothetical protein
MEPSKLRRVIASWQLVVSESSTLSVKLDSPEWVTLPFAIVTISFHATCNNKKRQENDETSANESSLSSATEPNQPDIVHTSQDAPETEQVVSRFAVGGVEFATVTSSAQLVRFEVWGQWVLPVMELDVCGSGFGDFTRGGSLMALASLATDSNTSV